MTPISYSGFTNNVIVYTYFVKTRLFCLFLAVMLFYNKKKKGVILFVRTRQKLSLFLSKVHKGRKYYSRYSKNKTLINQHSKIQANIN